MINMSENDKINGNNPGGLDNNPDTAGKNTDAAAPSEVDRRIAERLEKIRQSVDAGFNAIDTKAAEAHTQPEKTEQQEKAEMPLKAQAKEKTAHQPSAQTAKDSVKETPPKKTEQLANSEKTEPDAAAAQEIEAVTEQTEDISENTVSKQKKIQILFFSAAAVCLVVLVGVLSWVFVGSKKPVEPASGEEKKNIEDMSFIPGNVFGAALQPNANENTSYPEGIMEKYKRLYAADNLFCGWLSVPNTPIDTPIYHNPKSNNLFYIKRDLWSGEFSRYGTNFLDYRNNAKDLDRNTVIYGHNFDDNNDDKIDDILFGAVERYTDIEFYKQNPVIEFNTLYKDYKWKVIACFRTNGLAQDDNGYLFLYNSPIMHDQSFMQFVDEIKQRSYFHTGVDIKPDDKVLTLSTCTYFFDKNKTEDARCVLIARMVRPGESEAVDVSAAVKNENIRYPQLYYNVFGGTNPYKNASKWVAYG